MMPATIVSPFKFNLFGKKDKEAEASEATALPAPEHPTVVPRPSEEDAFSPMDLRDRVVIMLLFDQAVQIDAVEQAWVRWRALQRQGQECPLWRLLLDVPGVDADRVFAGAAKVYAFDFASISRYETPAFIRRQRATFADAQWQRLLRLMVLPIDQDADPKTQELRWVFATHDPTRHEVSQALKEIAPDRFVVQFMPRSLTLALIAEVYPDLDLDAPRLADLDVERLAEQAEYFIPVDDWEQEPPSQESQALASEVAHATMMHLFEEVLLSSLHRGASAVCFIPNEKREVEIVYRVGDRVETATVENRVHAEGLLTFIEDEVLQVPGSHRDVKEGIIQRWINEMLVRFRVAVLPLEHAPPGVYPEFVLIELIDQRKVLAEFGRLGLRHRDV